MTITRITAPIPAPIAMFKETPPFTLTSSSKVYVGPESLLPLTVASAVIYVWYVNIHSTKCT